MFESKRSFRIGVDVGDIRVVDGEVVDSERIDALYRVLPAFLGEWNFVCPLSTQLREIDAQPGMEQKQVGDDMPGEQLAPLYVDTQNRKASYRRARVRFLNQRNIAQTELAIE